MKRLALVTTLLLLMILTAPVGAAHADGGMDRIIKAGETVDEEVVVFGGNLVIEKGATVDGDVSVFGGSAVLDGEIDGNVAVFGGTVALSGGVDGDLVIFGGNLEADSAASVDGDCILVGGTLSGDGQGSVNCTAVGDFPGIAIPALMSLPSPPHRPSAPSMPEVPSVRIESHGRGFFGTIGSVAGRSLLLGILALAVAGLAPDQLGRVNNTLTRKPAASGVVGFLTALAVPSLAIILLILSIILTIVCIGLLGYPIVMVLLIALVVGGLLGWVAVGSWLGQRLAGAFRLSNRGLPTTAALGTAVLTLAAGLLGELPFWLGGWAWSLAAFALGCAGLGAVALTRFGTRPYPPAGVSNDEKVAAVLETLPVTDESEAPAK